MISASKNNTIKAFSEMQTKVTKAVEEINKLKNNVSTVLYDPLLNENLEIAFFVNKINLRTD